jgi:hypothetical protein
MAGGFEPPAIVAFYIDYQLFTPKNSAAKYYLTTVTSPFRRIFKIRPQTAMSASKCQT